MKIRITKDIEVDVSTVINESGEVGTIPEQYSEGEILEGEPLEETIIDSQFQFGDGAVALFPLGSFEVVLD